MSGDRIDMVKDAVCEFYGIGRVQMDSTNRNRRVAWPRQVAYALARECSSRSLPAIGARFYRDHTTIIIGIRQVYRRAGEDPSFAAELDTLRGTLKEDRESWLVRFKAERQACDAIAQFLKRELSQFYDRRPGRPEGGDDEAVRV